MFELFLQHLFLKTVFRCQAYILFPFNHVFQKLIKKIGGLIKFNVYFYNVIKLNIKVNALKNTIYSLIWNFGFLFKQVDINDILVSFNI